MKDTFVSVIRRAIPVAAINGKKTDIYDYPVSTGVRQRRRCAS